MLEHRPISHSIGVMLALLCLTPPAAKAQDAAAAAKGTIVISGTVQPWSASTICARGSVKGDIPA